MSLHNAYRQITRSTMRRPVRCRNRPGLRGRRHGPDDLSQALTALGRAVRAHRRLARLAPSFFDAAVVDREAENRAELRRWMASWEPALAKAYGVEPCLPDTSKELPPLPSPRTQRAVERKLAEREMWLAAGQVALERYRQRQPHALMSFSRMARLLQIGIDFGKLASGLDTPNRVPEKLVYDYELTDLKRAYGSELLTPAIAVVDSVPVARASASSPTVALHDPSAPVSQPAPPENTGSACPVPGNSDRVPAAPSSPIPPRCDAWSRWARNLRGRKC